MNEVYRRVSHRRRCSAAAQLLKLLKRVIAKADCIMFTACFVMLFCIVGGMETDRLPLFPGAVLGVVDVAAIYVFGIRAGLIN